MTAPGRVGETSRAPAVVDSPTPGASSSAARTKRHRRLEPDLERQAQRTPGQVQRSGVGRRRPERPHIGPAQQDRLRQRQRVVHHHAGGHEHQPTPRQGVHRSEARRRRPGVPQPEPQRPPTHCSAANSRGPVATPAAATSHAKSSGPASRGPGTRSGMRRSLPYEEPATNASPVPGPEGRESGDERAHQPDHAGRRRPGGHGGGQGGHDRRRRRHPKGGQAQGRRYQRRYQHHRPADPQAHGARDQLDRPAGVVQTHRPRGNGPSTHRQDEPGGHAAGRGAEGSHGPGDLPMAAPAGYSRRRV